MSDEQRLNKAVNAGLELLNFLDFATKEKLKFVFHFTSYMGKESGFYIDEKNDFCRKLFETFKENFGKDYDIRNKLSAVNEFCDKAKALGFQVTEEKIESAGAQATWETIIETAP